jgi:hypothetical protein
MIAKTWKILTETRDLRSFTVLYFVSFFNVFGKPFESLINHGF